jgi:apolipoprotein N-acyltransferase
MLLIVLSVVVPIVTLDYSGVDGPQPRVSLVSYFGIAGVVPAVLVLATSVSVAVLLRFSRDRSSRAAVMSVRGLSVALLLLTFLAMAFTHLAGLLVMPTVIALLVSAFTDAEQPESLPESPRPDPQSADLR